jgi:hypothetical protein
LFLSDSSYQDDGCVSVLAEGLDPTRITKKIQSFRCELNEEQKNKKSKLDREELLLFVASELVFNYVDLT